MNSFRFQVLSKLIVVSIGLASGLVSNSAKAQWDCTSMKQGSLCVGCQQFSQAHWKQYGYPQCVPCSEICFGWFAPPAASALASPAEATQQSTVPRCIDDPVAAAASRAFAADHWFFNIDVGASIVSQISAVNPPAASTLLAFSRMRNFPGDKRFGTVGFGSLPTSATVALELQDQAADLGLHTVKLPEGQGVAVEFRSQRLSDGGVVIELRSSIRTMSGALVREIGTPVRIEAALRKTDFVDFRTLGQKQVDQLEVLRWGIVQ